MVGCGPNSLIIHQCAPLIDSAKPKGVKAEAIMQRHTGSHNGCTHSGTYPEATFIHSQHEKSLFITKAWVIDPARPGKLINFDNNISNITPLFTSKYKLYPASFNCTKYPKLGRKHLVYYFLSSTNSMYFIDV